MYYYAMSGDRYYIHDQHSTHFLTFTVVEWTDIFTRPVYKHIITDSLNYCVGRKGLEVFAWVLMTNHMHLVCRVNPPFTLSDFMRDFKKYTSKQIINAIEQNAESRRDWLLHRFSIAAVLTRRAKMYKVWTDDNHAIYLEDKVPLFQKIDYVHNNPVKQEIVDEAHHYCFSSACDYAGSHRGLVKLSILKRH